LFKLIFGLNVYIALLSLVIIYLSDWPLEALGITGLVWAVYSSIEMLRAMRRHQK